MTLFALGAKWGARPSARTAGLQKSSRSRLPRAMVPMPKPACRKKCRRVTSFRISGQPLELLLAEGEKPGPLVGAGRAGDAEPERVVRALAGRGPRLAQHAPGQGP